jgi:hypothetical protein
MMPGFNDVLQRLEVGYFIAEELGMCLKCLFNGIDQSLLLKSQE